jgi:pilus assembly protein Flp/PilA
MVISRRIRKRVSRAFHHLYVSCRRCAMGDEGAQALVEYALVLVLIAIVVIIVLQMLGHTVNNVFSNVNNVVAA